MFSCVSFTCGQDVTQKVLGAVLCHRAACMAIKHSEEAPVSQLSTQLWHAVVKVLHVGPPALHASQGVGEAPAGAALLCQLVQDRPVQVGAGDDLLLLPLPWLLSLCCSSTAPFEERADPLLCLFHQLPHKRRHLHAALPGCPHGSYARLM